MASVHDLIARVGVEQARKLVPSGERKLIDTAAQAMAIESRAMGITYAGFCLTALPHNPLADDAVWERQGHKVKLVITPGYLPDRTGTMQLHGVPYGSRARLIMLYLQTRAIQTGSPEVELGASMKDWLSRMGVGVGGKQYRDVKEQANRISACNLTFVWDNDRRGKAFEKDAIVKGGIQLYEHDDENQLRLWVDTVRLSDSFFQALKEHPVPVWEPAMKLIAGKSMAIDVYVWLAYRLHVLELKTPVTWAALFGQFGHSYQNLKHFKPRFTEALKMALAVYPDAEVDVSEAGVVLHPSPPPIPERKMVR
ncbi:replication protein RepA [Azospirillum sp.]|uniref:replication protein RepA n=1 Tax=Azospirillum sp. TaxID=34012 RepID=UPI002D43B5F0|nr:replication protein RepA [Azospirillum sp.]HYF86153.1 replication protein RepA [Azospirillum sp.]